VVLVRVGRARSDLYWLEFDELLRFAPGLTRARPQRDRFPGCLALVESRFLLPSSTCEPGERRFPFERPISSSGAELPLAVRWLCYTRWAGYRPLLEKRGLSPRASRKLPTLWVEEWRPIKDAV
jgi:hypothetical protein